jgi:hypothetical protein
MTDRTLLDHVRRLAKSDKLDEHLPDVEGASGIWTLWFWIVSWFAYASAGIAIAFFALEDRPPDTETDFDHPSVYTALLLIPFGALCWLMSHLTVPKCTRRRKKLGRRGQLVPGAIVQVNGMWYEPDNQDPAPGSVVISFDPVAAEQPGRVQDVARALAALKRADRRVLPDDQVELAWDLYHEMGPLPSKPVPASLSQGLQDCWLVTTPLPPRPLRHGDELIVLALRGDPSHEAVAVLPEEIGPE